MSPIHYKQWEACNHELLEIGITFEKESNKEYWNNNQELQGSKCSGCLKKFVYKKQDHEDCKTSTIWCKHGAYYCQNRFNPEQKCDYMLCPECWKKLYTSKLTEESYEDAIKRPRTRRRGN